MIVVTGDRGQRVAASQRFAANTIGVGGFSEPPCRVILCLMAQYSSRLDTLFGALSDPTRRLVIGELGRGPASVGDLARSSPMTLPSFMKHIRMLESTGVIRTAKVGRVRTCTLDRGRLALVDRWLAEQRAIWEGRTDRLEQFVTAPREPS